MFKATDYKEILKFKNPIFIDLRSEGEFEDGTILGAISMPILSNEERKIVGTLYASGDVKRAKEKGVEFFAPKLTDYYKRISQMEEDHEVVLFCSRGGFRSTALFNLLKTLGHNVYKLNYGYKSYRKYVLNFMDTFKDYEYVVLKGYTGCGKTEILKELRKRGENVLDLEGLARHRGSLFGGVGMGFQPSQKTFESELIESFKSFKQGPIFVEGESPRIGSINLPSELIKAMAQTDKVFLIEDTIERRTERIKSDYLSDYGLKKKEEIISALENLKRYISAKRYENYLKLVDEENFDLIIKDLMIKYYDANYSINKDKIFYKILNEDIKKSCDTILDILK
ncbi:tRNA 2-selenouridine(34) synthase MnmH [Peptoniphilus sp. BV3AC2]|uniref:tRNA 2-selenouridine(34) synthase MnmH n=1 Tax=Peptoniphilus sp. BV3AC2 TaxID=1111133 RepID=UPI0003B8D19B|nr:tRNA 2-selenouridine(34) synthase MnmH [Peptoniphilus sp. BV3AC2]ERT62771.1 tRNA 2-selenouridine synthase [Peptoniphilus sp. BV3AC2]